VAAIRALPGVTRVSARVFAPVLAAPGERSAAPADAAPAMVVGADVVGESVPGGLLEGLNAAPGDGVVVGRVLANRLGLKAGQSLALIGQDADGIPVAELVTIAAVLTARTEVVNHAGVVMPMARAQALFGMGDTVNEIVVIGQNEAAAEALAAVLIASCAWW
jgi:ABC-type lipoprotein release transport system permease subunit